MEKFALYKEVGKYIVATRLPRTDILKQDCFFQQVCVQGGYATPGMFWVKTEFAATSDFLLLFFFLCDDRVTI